MSKKPSWHYGNKRRLQFLCYTEGYEITWLNEYQARILGATHVIDIWTPRMVHHIVAGEVVRAEEPYYRALDQEINEEQVIHLLETGKVE